MIVQCNVPLQMPVVNKLCKMWQILHDGAFKFVAEFSLLSEFSSSEMQPMAKRGVILKKVREFFQLNLRRIDEISIFLKVFHTEMSRKDKENQGNQDSPPLLALT